MAETYRITGLTSDSLYVIERDTASGWAQESMWFNNPLSAYYALVEKQAMDTMLATLIENETTTFNTQFPPEEG